MRCTFCTDTVSAVTFLTHYFPGRLLILVLTRHIAHSLGITISNSCLIYHSKYFKKYLHLSIVRLVMLMHSSLSDFFAIWPVLKSWHQIACLYVAMSLLCVSRRTCILCLSLYAWKEKKQVQCNLISPLKHVICEQNGTCKLRKSRYSSVMHDHRFLEMANKYTLILHMWHLSFDKILLICVWTEIKAFWVITDTFSWPLMSIVLALTVTMFTLNQQGIRLYK